MESAKLVEAFHEAMLEIYRAASEIGYHPTMFLRMVTERGGLAAARQLINDRKPSDGFTRLWELKRLDLSVEAVALQKRWRQLFTVDELAAARQRLLLYNFDPDTVASPRE